MWGVRASLRVRMQAGALAALAALSPLLASCGTSDPRRNQCGGDAPKTCPCANGSEGKPVCVGGTLTRCMCGAAPASHGDGGATDFQNASKDASIDLLDASPIDRSDGRVIDVDTECGQQESQAVIDDERPVDVIFIIDNSGSMSSEITAVERNINQNFAQIIEASGADYRVIMLTDHGADSLSVCVDQPLAAKPCSDSTDPLGSTMGAPANSTRFFHYDINVQSNDSVCLMLMHYQVDPTVGPFPQTGAAAAPTGWHEWLRPNALKVFVEITDDRLSCSVTTPTGSYSFGSDYTLTEATQVARDVYRAIQGLSAAQFGTPEKPNFIWHSIVGIVDNNPPELPYTHFDPPKLDSVGACSSAVNSGAAYQMLSISTAGLRFPVCAADTGHGYDSVFQAIAHEVVRGARVDCAFNIPSPPPGKFVDYGSVVVRYTPGGGRDEDGGALAGGPAELFEHVTEAKCNDSSFYFGDREIKLCPQACQRVRADQEANVSVTFGCGPEVKLDPDLGVF